MAGYLAALLYKPEEIRIEELELPAVNPEEVLVRLEKATLCPTDIKKYRGEKAEVAEGLERYGPYILGHEGAGRVVQIGPGVNDFAVGDKVAIQPIISCGQCVYCRGGEPNLCLAMAGVGAAAGPFASCQLNFINKGIGGCFAQYLKVPAACLIKLPADMDLAAGSLVEPLADVVHSVEAAAVDERDVVVIFGLGPMGLFHVAVTKYYRAARIIGIDLDEGRLQVAGRLGADLLVNPGNEDPVARVKEITGGIGAHKIFITSGGQAQATCTDQALTMAAKKGVVNLFASAASGVQSLTIDLNRIHYNMLNLKGTVGFGLQHAARAVELLAGGAFDYRLIRNYELPLTELARGMELYGKGDYLKIGIDLNC
ncbi:MAG: L-iditol 2-dehydrogenase [Clostridia bacterium]|nr:L-iditol 2-dehydrogenase [Clostridia bacterium]